jgi:hypothetical protein
LHLDFTFPKGGYMAPAPNNGKTSAAALLEQQRGQTEQAADRIDKDPEEALDALERAGLQKAPNVGEITQTDMFNMMRQMQEQMSRMQEQVIALMTGKLQGQGRNGNENLAEELEKDRLQRERTLESWRTEPREPVWIQPDDDEQKIYSVTNQYPPRIYRINGLEFPIMVGEIAEVPASIAVVVRGTQRRRPMQGPPQGLPQISDPQRAQFLSGSNAISVGQAGKAGEGKLVPAAVAASPSQAGPLDVRYDHNGQ